MFSLGMVIFELRYGYFCNKLARTETEWCWLNCCQQLKACSIQMLSLKIQCGSSLCRRWTKSATNGRVTAECITSSRNCSTADGLAKLPSFSFFFLVCVSSGTHFLLLLFGCLFFFPRPEMNELLCFPNICHCSMWLLYLNCLFRVAISLSKSESAWNHTLPHPHELLPSWCEASTSSCGPEGTKKNQDCK